MNYLQNHIWCSDSNWGGNYDCRHLVSISSFEEDEDDWNKIIDNEVDDWVDRKWIGIVKEFSQKRGEPFSPDESEYIRKVPNLKPHILDWLNRNVEDRKDPDCIKGWCVGSCEYRYANPTSFTVFFHRKRDAMAFIKNFSKYKKPVYYCQYFSDVRKRLNLETLKYEEN